MPIIFDEAEVSSVLQRTETIIFRGSPSSTHSIVDVHVVIDGEYKPLTEVKYSLYINSKGTIKRYVIRRSEVINESPSLTTKKIIVAPGDILYAYIESSDETNKFNVIVNSVVEKNPVVVKANSSYLYIRNEMGPSEVYRNDSPLGIYEVGNLCVANIANFDFKFELWITDNETVVLTGEEALNASDVKIYTGLVKAQGSWNTDGLLLPPLHRIYIRTFPHANKSFLGSISYHSIVVGD